MDGAEPSVAVLSEAPPRGLRQHLKALMARIDAYAVYERPHSSSGAFVSLLIMVATVGYSTWVIIEFLNQSCTTDSKIFWTRGKTFPMGTVCLAQGGCFVSNKHHAKWTGGIEIPDPSQTGCFHMEYKEEMVLNATYSLNPLEGINIIYNGSSTDPDSPPTFGLALVSQVACELDVHNEACIESAIRMDPPLGPGLNYIYMVETFNATVSGLGSHRYEWFVSSASEDPHLRLIAGADPCLIEHPELAAMPGMVRSELRLEAAYSVLHAYYQSIFFILIGAVGGAYTLFIQGGAVLLMIIFLSAVLKKMWHKSTSTLPTHDPVVSWNASYTVDEQKGQVKAGVDHLHVRMPPLELSAAQQKVSLAQVHLSPNNSQGGSPHHRATSTAWLLSEDERRAAHDQDPERSIHSVPGQVDVQQMRGSAGVREMSGAGQALSAGHGQASRSSRLSSPGPRMPTARLLDEREQSAPLSGVP